MIEVKNNTWIMPSHLDASIISILTKKNIKQISTDSSWILDFSKCNKVDSAGLAMVIDCIKHAKKTKVSLKILNLSDDAISLAKVHGIEEILSKHTS
ncbi:MAG: phospholipid transport system transporter-binding protein [Francisella sp.]|jgi:phospholipid transport system transporter-binding protein